MKTYQHCHVFQVANFQKVDIDITSTENPGDQRDGRFQNGGRAVAEVKASVCWAGICWLLPDPNQPIVM